MKILLLTFTLLTSSFHKIAVSEDGIMNARVFASGDKTMIYLDVDNAENIDSLIIHTDIWRIVLQHSPFTDESIFVINTAEATVLRKDLVKNFELRINGESKYYKSTDRGYIREQLTQE